jgi:hypothetical protein
MVKITKIRLESETATDGDYGYQKQDVRFDPQKETGCLISTAVHCAAKKISVHTTIHKQIITLSI